MNIKYFNYTDTDGDDIKLEINLDLLKARTLATIYNFNGDIISRNKIVGKWNAKNKDKFFKILKNNIGNMSETIKVEYLNFIKELEEKLEEKEN